MLTRSTYRIPRPGRRVHILSSTVVLCFLVIGCASQRPPEGGPVDTDAPVIEQSWPENGTTRFEGQEVTLRFSEYIRRQSFQEAVHISPLPPTPPTYEWSGKEVTIVFPDTLAAERTYVVTVGTKVRDANASNPMKETFHLAFSTGDSLDRGSFQGTVIDEKPSGVSVFAYLLSEGRADTLNPVTERPDYVVQSADDGSFHFYNVVPGTYRVFAVRDRGNNLRYDREADAIGVPPGDIFVRDSIPPRPPLRFVLSTEDTTRPSIQRIEAVGTHMVRVKFNEPVYPQPLPLHGITIIDSAAGTTLPLLAAAEAPGERYTWDIFLQTPLPTSGMMILKADSIFDAMDNPLLPIDSAVSRFPAAAEQDTTRPKITQQYPGAREKKLPPDSAFTLRFDRPMRFDMGATLSDSSGANVPLTHLWTSPLELQLRHDVLLDEAAYTLCIQLESLRDSIAGMSVADTTQCVSFTTGIQDRFGSVAGSVLRDSALEQPAHGTIVVRLRETGKNGGVQVAKSDSSGKFSFSRVLEGKYVLDAYGDENANNRYDAGNAFPFTPPEPSGLLRDTLRVRARWETNNVRLRIR